MFKPIASIAFGLALRGVNCYDYGKNGSGHCFLRSSSSRAHNDSVHSGEAATFDPTSIQGFTPTGESHPSRRRLAYCGMDCWNQYGCSSSSDGCTLCDFTYGNGRCVQPPSLTKPSSPSNNCFTQCTDSWQCTAQSGACTFCEKFSFGVFGKCVPESRQMRVPCVSTFSALQAAFLVPTDPIVTICDGPPITLSSEIIVNGSNWQLKCANVNMCEIRRDPSSDNVFRLLTFTGNNISLSDVTFSGGLTSGNGGAVLLKGIGNTVRNCTFKNNQSYHGSGGGLYMKSGILQGNSYEKNDAYNCRDAHVKNRCSSS